MTVRDVPWMNADGGQPDYSAADFRLVGSALAGHTGTSRLLGARSGVVPGVASALEVTHDGLTPGEVTVDVGQAWIDADLSLGAYLVTVEVAETFPVPAAGTVTRTDRVIVRARDAEVDASVGTDRSGAVEYLAGDNGTGNPQAVPDHALLLAEVTVPVASTPTVTDMRVYQARTDSIGLPVRNLAEQDSITDPYAGQSIFRRDTGDVKVYDGNEWQSLREPAFIEVWHEGTTRIAGNTARIVWDNTEEASGGASRTGSRIELPAGVYTVVFHAVTDGASGDHWEMLVRKNSNGNPAGGQPVGQTFQPNDPPGPNKTGEVTKHVRMVDGDYLECFIGLGGLASGPMNVFGDRDRCYFTAAQIGI